MEHYIIHAFKTWMFRVRMFICGEMLVVATGGRGLAMKAREARCDGQGRSLWRKTLLSIYDVIAKSFSESQEKRSFSEHRPVD